MSYIDGLQKAKEIILSLSVKPPENYGERMVYNDKAPILKELQDKAVEYIDAEIKSYGERLTQV